MLVPKPLLAYLRERCHRKYFNRHQQLILNEDRGGEEIERKGSIQIELQQVFILNVKISVFFPSLN